MTEKLKVVSEDQGLLINKCKDTLYDSAWEGKIKIGEDEIENVDK